MLNNRNHYSTLRIGDVGHDVMKLQKLLFNEKLYLNPIDGRFGHKTQRAVIALQKSENLVPDGIVDADIWTVLGIGFDDKSHAPHGKCPSRECPSETFPYTIKQGDTLYAISVRYNTTVNAIIKINSNINPNKLQVGRVICIPNRQKQMDPIVYPNYSYNLSGTK